MRRHVVTLSLAAALLLVLPASALAAKLVTWTTTSRFVDPAKLAFNGPKTRAKKLRVNVYLPNGYNGQRRFPVLYLLHGHGDAYDSWADPKHGDVEHIARSLGAVVVMPEGARGWYANWWNGGARAGPAWERYYLEELIPLVERRLQIRRGRRWHAIAGLSMGGGGSLLLAALKPGYFGSAASFSGAISIQRGEWPVSFDTQGEKYIDVYGDPGAQRFYWTGHNPTALSSNLHDTRLFVAVGDGVPGSASEAANYFGAVAEIELRQQANDFVRAAHADGNDAAYRPQQGIHDWPYWRRHLTQMLAWGPFNPVTEHAASWSYDTASQRGEAWGLAFRFAAPPATLERFRRRGSTLSATGAGKVAIDTPGGCRLVAALPFTRSIPSGCTLHVSVRPRRVRAGKRRRFHFRAWVVRDGKRVAARRVRIRFAGRARRTGPRGRAAITLRLRKRGFRNVRAARRGLHSATPAQVRVSR